MPATWIFGSLKNETSTKTVIGDKKRHFSQSFDQLFEITAVINGTTKFQIYKSRKERGWIQDGLVFDEPK